jgi:E3 ubiquitin-protein ligase HUWE1
LAHPNAYEKVGDRVIGAAFVALEAILRYRSKATEVLSAVNANVGHGILMSCFRSLVARLSSDQGESSGSFFSMALGVINHAVLPLDAPHDLMDSILAFLGFAATIPGANNMLVGAGIIPLLIDLVKVDGPGKASVGVTLAWRAMS